jgi:hypothetical protein
MEEKRSGNVFHQNKKRVIFKTNLSIIVEWPLPFQEGLWCELKGCKSIGRLMLHGQLDWLKNIDNYNIKYYIIIFIIIIIVKYKDFIIQSNIKVRKVCTLCIIIITCYNYYYIYKNNIQDLMPNFSKTY